MKNQDLTKVADSNGKQNRAPEMRDRVEMRADVSLGRQVKSALERERRCVSTESKYTYMHVHDKVEKKEMIGQEKNGRSKLHHIKEGISRSYTKYINKIMVLQMKRQSIMESLG